MSLLYSAQKNIGWEAPDFDLPDSGGSRVKLSDVFLKAGVLILFTCNHCPYAKAAWPIIIELFKKYRRKGVEFIAINSNDSQAYPEDSIEIMRQKTFEWRIYFPYLRDETQEVAKKYDAQCTPDVYLFDKDRKLYYHGRINDNWQDSNKVIRHDLEEALQRLIIGDKPPVEQFPSMGCSIKWK